TLVGSFLTTDPDVGDGFTYSLVSGPGSSGNSQFTIVGDQLLTNAVFNYEAQSSYSILVRTTDAGGLSFDQTFTITITDVNDAPQLGNAQFSVTENSPALLLVGTLTATDADPGTVFTYMLTGGNTGGAFSIDPSNGQLKVANPLAINFEAKQTFNLTIVASDNGNPQLSASAAVTVNVLDINEAPTSLGLTNSSVDENLPANTTVGQFLAIDPDAGNTLTYSLIAGSGDTGNSQFHIVGNQLLTSASFDRETVSSYSIRARVTDQGGLSFDKVLTITVNNVDEAPTGFVLLPSTVPETKPAGIKVGSFVTSDVDVGDTFTYTLQSGVGSDDNGIFIIDGNDLLTTTVLDFESLTTYSIRVRTTDQGGLSFERPVIVDVSNRNEAPTDILLSSVEVAENQPAGTSVGNFSAIDQDLADQFTYSLVAGVGSTDNAMFNIVGGQLVTSAPLDFETHNTYFIRVQAMDLGGKTYQRPLTIHVSNVNDAPIDIALSPNSIAESATVNTVVGVLSTTDPDFGDSFTYSLVAGVGAVDNASFQVSGQQVTLKAPLDFELKSDYSIRVQSVDAGGLSVQKVVVIHVSNTNDAPTGLNLSKTTIPENSPQGTEVGKFQPVDSDAGDTFTYSLVTGVDSTDNNQFLISGDRLLALTKFNFETQPTRSIRMRVTDAGGLSFERSFVIQVTNANEAPTGAALSSATVPENQPVGTVVGNLSTTDVDVGDTFTYSLVPGTGDADNAAFGISGQQLVTAASFNFEGQKIYHVRVRTTDSGGQTFERALTIEVTNVNEAPTSLTLLGTHTVGENLAAGTRVGTLQGTDPDQGDVLTFSLATGTGDSGNGQFQIVGNELRTAAMLDFETHPTYSVRIRATDSHGATLDQFFSLIVQDGAEPPRVVLNAATRAALRRQVVAIDEQASLVDPDSPNFTGGGLSIAVTGGATSDVLELRNGSTSEGVAWKLIRGGTVLQIANQTVATIQGGTKGQPLEIHFQGTVSRGLAEALLRNITFRGTTAATRTVTVRATDDTGRVSEAATRLIQVT
ncbi:MAG: cya 3, partial [Planctomycetaceae bacterium]|nr:cya 3 [Planctomycetaceae bacterium]